MFNSSYLVINTRLVYVLIDSCSMHVLLLLVAFRSTTCFVHIPNILTDQVGKKNQSLCANKYLLCGISAFVLMCVPF